MPKQADLCQLQCKKEASRLRDPLVIKTCDPNRPYLVEIEWVIKHDYNPSQLATNVRNFLGRTDSAICVDRTFTCAPGSKWCEWNLITVKELEQVDGKSSESNEISKEDFNKEKEQFGCLTLLNPPPGSRESSYSFFPKTGGKKGLTFITLIEWGRIKKLGCFEKGSPNITNLQATIDSILEIERSIQNGPSELNAIDYSQLSPVSKRKVMFGEFKYLEPQ